MDKELKRCPLCGSEAGIEVYYTASGWVEGYIVCANDLCGLQISDSGCIRGSYTEEKKEAKKREIRDILMKRWNNRWQWGGG